MIPLYVVIVALGASNIATLCVLYKLITQLTSKIMAPDIHTYSLVEGKKVAKVEPRMTGTPIRHQERVAIDEVDPDRIMESLAVATGRIDEYDGPEI